MKTKEAETVDPSTHYTNEEINEIAEWVQDLTIQQLFFLRDSYTAFIAMQTMEMESSYVQ